MIPLSTPLFSHWSTPLFKAVSTYICKENNYVIAEVLSAQKITGSANRRQYMVRKSQIRKLLHLRKVRKSVGNTLVSVHGVAGSYTYRLSSVQ